MKKRTLFILLLLALLAACNMPGVTISVPGTQVPVNESTAAAQTVVATITNLAPSAMPVGSPTPIIPPTLVPVVTSTTVPSSTPVPIPCNRASYDAATIDVTIPDGTAIQAGAAFTKTWRITNVGTCTWTSAYQAVFHQGDALGVPAGYAQSLTSGTVPPGGSMDISVNLTAPVTSGDYKGYWRLREPGGQYFGLGPSNGDFTVVIKVSGDTVTSLNPIAGESGSVRATGSVLPNTLSLGDTVTDDGAQVFLSFDISSIPAGSTIKHVSFDISQGYSVSGTPFTTLGCIYFYAHNFGALDAGDFILVPPAGGLIKKCNKVNLDAIVVDDEDWINAVQARVGTTRFQLRLQFSDNVTDFNATKDMVNFGTIKLTITYKRP